MQSLDAKLTTMFLVGCVVALYLAFDIVRRGADDLYAFRVRRRQRVAESGLAFPVMAKRVLPHEDDGPGRYLVSGVVDRTGRPTSFEVDASGVPDALRKALERGVTPSSATKRKCENPS
jgi:hypothetical protein